MSEQELRHKLIKDLRDLKLPIDEVDLVIRPYSKTYYGRYFPINKKRDITRPRIFIYPYEYPDNRMFPYLHILKTMVHELCHHIQFSSGSYVRRKGVMHNPNFWTLYQRYVSKIDSMYEEQEVVNEV